MYTSSRWRLRRMPLQQIPIDDVIGMLRMSLQLMIYRNLILDLLHFVSVYRNMFSEGHTPSLSRFTSIRSSLSSIYRNYDFHFDLINMTGLVVLLSLISATLVLTTSVYEMEKVYNRSDCMQFSTDLNYPWNDTNCIKEFEFSKMNYICGCAGTKLH